MMFLGQANELVSPDLSELTFLNYHYFINPIVSIFKKTNKTKIIYSYLASYLLVTGLLFNLS